MLGIESDCSWFIQMHPFLGDDCKASSLNLLFDCITVVGSNSIRFHHCKCPLNPFRLCTSIQGVDRFLNLNYLPLIFILCTTLLLTFSHNFTKNVKTNQIPSKIWDKKEDATSDPQVGMQKLYMQRWSKFNPILPVSHGWGLGFRGSRFPRWISDTGRGEVKLSFMQNQDAICKQATHKDLEIRISRQERNTKCVSRFCNFASA